MVIYKYLQYEYTTDDLFFDKPCQVDNILLYPIKVKDYQEFQEYLPFFTLSKKHLGVKNGEKINLLFSIIYLFAKSESGNAETIEESIMSALIKLARAFSILTQKEIEFRMTEDDFEFYGDGILINEKNYNKIRKVILKMSLTKEPKIFEREIDRKWHEKAIKARMKDNPNLDLGEIVLIVSQDLKVNWKEIYNDFNIFQMYAYYYRQMQIYKYETTRLFATVSSDVKPSNFADSIFALLYEDNDKDLTVKSDGFMKYLD